MAELVAAAERIEINENNEVGNKEAERNPRGKKKRLPNEIRKSKKPTKL